MKKVTSILLTCVAMIMIGASVYAVGDSYSVTLKLDKTKVKQGETIQVSIGVKDIQIQTGEKGIGAYTAKVEYDTNVFEKVEAKAGEEWDTPLLQNGLITGNRSDAQCSNKDQTVAILTFTVKDSAKLGNTTIKVTNFSGSNGVSDLASGNVEIKTEVVNKNGESGNTNTVQNEITNTTTNETTNTTTNTVEKPNINNTITNSISNVTNTTITNSDNSTAQGKIPQTGAKTIFIPSLIGASILSIVLFKKYRTVK